MRTKSYELMKRIMEYIETYYSVNGRSPSIREISENLQISVGCVSNYLKEMENRKMLLNSGGSRGIVTENIVDMNNSIRKVALIGRVACGKPLLAEENIECYLAISSKILGSGEHFILKAQGDSMINAGINDGDLVIVRQQENAENGQIVVALINDEATLKRYYKDDGQKKIRLHPENDTMQDMYFDKVKIQGIAVKVIKNLI